MSAGKSEMDFTFWSYKEYIIEDFSSLETF